MIARVEEKKANASEELQELKQAIIDTFDEAIKQANARDNNVGPKTNLASMTTNLKERTLEALEKSEIDISYAEKIARSTSALMTNIAGDSFLDDRYSREQRIKEINETKKEYIRAVKLFLKNTNPPFKQKCREVLRAIGMLIGAVIGFFICYNKCAKKDKVEEVKQPQDEKEQARDETQTASSESKADQAQPSNRSNVLKAGVGAALGVSAGYYSASFFTRNTNEGITALADEATRYCKTKIQDEKNNLPEEPEEEKEEKSSRCCCW